MVIVTQDFQARVDEIQGYFEFIKSVDNEKIQLIDRDLQTQSYSAVQRDNLLRTLKASAFLMLYNLMEATVKNAFEAVFDELETRRISYDVCRKEIKLLILENLKFCNHQDHLRNRGVTDVLELLNNLAIDAVGKTFQKDDVVSGNVDAREIKSLASSYGIDHPAANGADLLTVKTNRNDLAHGSKTFAEIGRDFDMPRMINIKNAVIVYLSKFMANVSTYLNQQQYLVGPGRP
jgi:hypothetical protein